MMCRKTCERINKKFNILNNIPDICENCANCLKCAEVCPSGAIEIIGREYSSEDLYDALIRDREFYAESGGGVTFSGGEPLLRTSELIPVMKKLSEEKISIDIETAGNVRWGNFEIVLPYIDKFLFDIKCIDENLHKYGAGSLNKQILENFNKLYNTSRNSLIVRIPVIPGFNADEKNIEDIALFLKDYPQIKYAEFMPFHATASHKYEDMNLKNDFEDYKNMDANSELIKRFRELFKAHNINIK